MSFRAFILGTALLSSGVSMSSHAEVVTNGGFDNGLTGWTTNNAFLGNGDYAVPSGNPAAVLGSSFLRPGRIQQTLNTVAGQTYDLSFTYWGWNPASTGKTLDLLIDVVGAATQLSDVQTTASYVTPTDPSAYYRMSYSFVADSASSLLRFQHSNTDTTLAIDDVSVTARTVQGIPEPSTGLLALAALGALTSLRRRL